MGKCFQEDYITSSHTRISIPLYTTTILCSWVWPMARFTVSVSAQQIGVELFLHHHVGDGQFGFSFVHAADGEHPEIVEQAHEIIRIGDTGGREAVFQITGDKSLAH